MCEKAKEKVMIAMSGGVDSSASAKLIIDSGYDAIGGTLRLTDGLPFCESSGVSEDILCAKKVCEKFNIDHVVIDSCDAFRKFVVDDFVRAYKEGKTPNPCIVCNKNIKFGTLVDAAEELGCHKLATGHYARIDRDPSGRFILKTALDNEKDQSYMLWTLSQEQLSKVVLPLGGLKKSEVRTLASEAALENADKKDSQDICFIPDGKYAAFIQAYANYIPLPGNYKDMEGKILGQHKGIINYTVGQRKGLGISLGKTMFVHSKSALDNTVTLCDSHELYSNTLIATDINLIAVDRIDTPLKVQAKARYRQTAVSATAVQTGENELRVIFDEPIRAISPGQSVVLYDGDVVIGGGIIN